MIILKPKTHTFIEQYRQAETMNVFVGNINAGLKAPNALRPE